MTRRVASIRLHPLDFGAKDNSRPLFPRAGAWLFRQRTWIPVPLALALWFVRAGEASPSSVLVLLGAIVVICGEGLRLWAVRHIGVVSRTRSDRLGPLVSTGPFGVIRNPLYLGNIALWIGFALSARLVWIVPVFIIVLGLEYHAIVRWEEQLLASRRGDQYQAYAGRVPRWMPSVVGRQSTVVGRQSTVVSQAPVTFSWRETLFSERGTLIAIAVGYLLLWMKTRL